MRLAIIGSGLLAAGCAGTPTADNSQPANRVCGVDVCFNERDVRDFEVIQHTTLIAYVGNERCPYQIEVHGTFCDLEFAPEIYFNTLGGADPDATAFGGANANLRDLRICQHDINVGVSGGVLTDNPADERPLGRGGNQRSDCQISSVEPLTDDRLIELYVRRGVVAPPPPMGSGKIEVGEQTSTEPTSPSSDTQAGTRPAGTTEEGGASPRQEDAQTAASAAPR
jgi:hypothetical protein